MAADEGFAGFLNAIPNAAASPLALVAYAIAVAAWVAIGLNTRRLSILMTRIQTLPKEDRKPTILATIGYVDIPDGITGEQYLRQRIHTFIFWGFIAVCIVLGVIVGMSFYKYYEKREAADNMINGILSSPSSQFMSSVNVLSNGPQIVTEAVRQLGPGMSIEDIRNITDELRLQHLNADQIERRLTEYAGTDQLRKINQQLLNASKVVDEAFASLATCFRELNCVAGTQFSQMCRMVTSIQSNIDGINQTARAIPHVMFNGSGTTALLGNGSLDIYFEAILSKSVLYLSSLCPHI